MPNGVDPATGEPAGDPPPLPEPGPPFPEPPPPIADGIAERLAELPNAKERCQHVLKMAEKRQVVKTIASAIVQASRSPQSVSTVVSTLWSSKGEQPFSQHHGVDDVWEGVESEECGDGKTEEASDVEGQFSAQQSSVTPSKPTKFTHHPKVAGKESLDGSLDGSVQGKFFSGDGSKEP